MVTYFYYPEGLEVCVGGGQGLNGPNIKSWECTQRSKGIRQ